MSDWVAGSEMAGDADAPKAAAPKAKPPFLKFLPIAVIAAGLALGYAMGWHQYLSLEYLAQSREALKGYAAANPVLAPAMFFALYMLAAAFAFPACSILTIFAGFLFGWLTGACLVAFAATAGASLLFLAARSACGDFFRRRAAGWIAKLADGFEKNAFGYLFVLRLAPVIPFFVLNIVPAFFKVRLRTFAAATFLGILPGTFAYAYLGAGVDGALAAAARAGADVSIGDLVTPQLKIAFAVLALVAAIPVVVRSVRACRPS